jgi:glycosyltransferase involved in cell wall biosynthesis
MRIALLQPTYWPEVRRGGERIVHDLGVSLARRGHDVTLLTTHPGRTVRSNEDGMTVIRSRRPPSPPPLSWYEDHLAGLPVMIARLLSGSFDVAHGFFPAQSWGAVKARRLGGPPVVSSLFGLPVRSHLVARRYRIEMMRASMVEADRCTVLSHAAAAAVRRYLDVDPAVLYAGVLPGRFEVTAQRASSPAIVCAASIGDPRKRGRVLLEAFTRLRGRVPDAELAILRPSDPFMSTEIHDLPPGSRWIEDEGDESLARLYAASWISVLPAVGEPLGLVMIESLAAGTPVVAARSGACPEVLDSPAVGCLVEPDDPAALAAGMAEALELARRPATTHACRDRARHFEWPRLVEAYEREYELAGASR